MYPYFTTFQMYCKLFYRCTVFVIYIMFLFVLWWYYSTITAFINPVHRIMKLNPNPIMTISNLYFNRLLKVCYKICLVEVNLRVVILLSGRMMVTNYIMMSKVKQQPWVVSAKGITLCLGLGEEALGWVQGGRGRQWGRSVSGASGAASQVIIEVCTYITAKYIMVS
jgi:hypothetical protein